MSHEFTRVWPPEEDPQDERIKRFPIAEDIQIHPQALGSLFAKRPLILGESESEYDELLSVFTAALKPSNAVDAMSVRDVVDYIWEAQRNRRMKVSLLMGGRARALRQLVSLSDSVVTQWLAGDEAALATVKDTLMKRGLDWDSVMAQALSDSLPVVEQIDRMGASADARRERALNNLERRREARARQLKRVAEDI